jgi:hypothetical protein
MKKITKFAALALMLGMSFGTAFLLNAKKTNEAQIWVGVAYAASEAGHSNEAVAGVGVLGVAQTTLWGMGMGGPAGAAVGAVFGL